MVNKIFFFKSSSLYLTAKYIWGSPKDVLESLSTAVCVVFLRNIQAIPEEITAVFEEVSVSFVPAQRRQKHLYAYLWVFTPHQWLVWEQPLAEEWIQFQSSMADYSWQGLTSSCQHWSYNRCFVSSTLQSLKDKTVFSFAHRELLLAATPLFLITGVSWSPATGSRLTPELCVFGGQRVLTHQTESLDFKPHILPLLSILCTVVNKEIKAPGGCELEHHSGRDELMVATLNCCWELKCLLEPEMLIWSTWW